MTVRREEVLAFLRDSEERNDDPRLTLLVGMALTCAVTPRVATVDAVFIDFELVYTMDEDDARAMLERLTAAGR